MDGISDACATIAGVERHHFIPQFCPDAAIRKSAMVRDPALRIDVDYIRNGYI
jgi:hypothetical protein